MDLSNRSIRKDVAAVFSTGMVKIPHLEALLGVSGVLEWPSDAHAGDVDIVIGWGTKPTARKARAYASRNGLPYVAVEDGFLRSAGSASAKLPPVSVVVDDRGIYYEAARPSRIEHLIRSASHLDARRRAEAEEGFDLFLRHRLTKYNTVAPAGSGSGSARRRWKVLLVDQVFGDQSIAGGLASAGSFLRMIETALRTFAAADIAVKVHPDVMAGRARGYIDRVARDQGLHLIADMGNPHDLLERVDAVWTVTSQLGLEAAFRGLPVRCFGVPFFAGWGLTEDTPDDGKARMALSRRGETRTALDIFAAAYLEYANYADPVGGRVFGLLEAIDRLVSWRDHAEGNRIDTVCVSWPLTERKAARSFFNDGGNRLSFAGRLVGPILARRTDARLLFWKEAPGIDRHADPRRADRGVVGISPMDFFEGRGPGRAATSLVVDDRAPFGKEGRLDWVLGHYPFNERLRARGKALATTLVAGLAAAAGDGEAAERSTDQVLVVLGEKLDGVRRHADHPFASNLLFLRAVRDAFPDARLLYVDHPDCAARAAPGWLTEDMAAAWADGFETLERIVAGKVAVDGVHTVGSDAGFAALMAGLPVTCWGAPFYAGRGLTTDRAPVPDGRRRLTLDELVAGTLIVASSHIDARTGIPCSAEDVATRILAEREGRLTRRLLPRTAWYAPALAAANRLRARFRQFVSFS
ncbi:capsular polysaccharide export protein, LipB/KpsS family [Rhodobium gokarnense]|uniref:Capsular polysaccharide export protein n=1 Tax=Rhodobium gokarnense TaxID=364296 RepID=A0ABT3HA95_9HYPH|nr:hypothetical protein [Rhodobium gokarnense]MCW2307314.1 capsular polysaccharide export protein [Rhodobium gokarnense]